MNNRYSRPNGPRGSVAPIHRGPQASAPGAAATLAASYSHSPNAALLIDFDNVTMGIRSDLQTELKNLLSSDIIRGKVQLQRAYADWRRYPQYVVPLAESSIDMIMAPAYGSSKKNATDIRLAVDAMELVFTRPEIGTYILLSGDSDFSTLVIKLKEYGKYVIGVGIRESSSDLLVMNCDEYYSYNALAGLVNSKDEEGAPRHDPWELVSLAISRMKKNGDVMRSDRLKQVMQEIDSSFDEKNLGMSKFSRFCQEAAGKGLLQITKLENGQLEVAPPEGASLAAGADDRQIASRPPRENGVREGRDRGRGRGRGRGGRDREDRPGQTGSDVAPPRMLGDASENGTSPGTPDEMLVQQDGGSLDGAPDGVSVNGLAMDGQPNDGPMSEAEIVESGIAQQRPDRPSRGDRHRGRGDRGPRPERTTAAPAPRREDIGSSGERFTRDEAFDLVRRAVASVVSGDESTSAERVRVAAFTLLGHDSESLSERNFARILRDAHDGDVIDLRRRGDDYEVAIAAQAAPVAEQLNQAAAANAPVAAPTGPAAPRGMGPRSAPGRGGRGGFGRGGAGGPPPELLMVGVVDHGEPAASEPAAEPERAGPHAASRTASNSESDESAESDASQTIARANAEAEANEEAGAAEEAPADEATTTATKRPAARGARGVRGRGAVAKKTVAKKSAAPVEAEVAEPAAAATKSAAAKKPRRPRARSKTAAAKKA